MLNNIKIATKDTFIYSLGNISTKVVGLILLPLYTDVLTVEEYGVLGTVEITLQVLITAFSLSLYQALNRWYWDNNYRNKQNSIFFTILVSLFLGASLMFLFFLPFSKPFSLALLDSTQYAYLFKLLLVGAFLQIISRLFLSLMRLQRKPIMFSVTNVIKMLVTLGLTIYFVAGLKRGLEGIMEAQIIGFLVFILINLKYIISNITPVFERSILKEMLLFSYPLAISSISGVLLTVTDRYVVRYIGGLNDMGLYSLGFKVANVLKIFVINSVGAALLPLKFQMMDKPNNKRFYSKIMTYTSFGFVVLLLILSLFSQEVIKLVAQNPAYWDAYHIVPILCFAQLFELLRRNARFGLIVKKKTKIISIIMMSVFVINIGLNVLLVSYFRTFGAAVASLTVQFIFFILMYHYAQKFYFIPYEMRKILMIILVGAFLVILSFIFVNPMKIFPRILVKLGLIASFPILLYSLNFYEPVELNRLRGAWNKWKNPLNWRKNIKNINIS